MSRRKILLSMLVAAAVLVCWAGVAMAARCTCLPTCTTCDLMCREYGLDCTCRRPTPSKNSGTLKGSNAIIRYIPFAGAPEIDVELAGFSLSEASPLDVKFIIGERDCAHAFSGNGGHTVAPFTEGAFASDKAGKRTIYASSDGNSRNYACAKSDIGYLWLKHAPKLSGDTVYTMFVDGKHEADFICDLLNSDPDVATQLHAKVGGTTVGASRTGDGRVIFHFTEAQLNSLALGAHPVYGWGDESENSDAIAEVRIGTINIVQRDCSMIVVRPILSGVAVSPGTGGNYAYPAYVRHPIYGPKPSAYVKGKYPISIEGYLQKVETSVKAARKAVDATGKVILYHAKTKPVQITRTNSYAFTFAAADMQRLEKGLYRFLVSSAGFKGNGRKIPALPFTQIGLVNVMTATAPAGWAIPKALTISVAREYPLLQILIDGANPNVRFSAPRTITVANGRVKAGEAGKATIAATDELGGYAECAVTVVPDMLDRPYPLVLNRRGLFTSAHQLGYEGDHIRARVYLTNRSDVTVKSLSGYKYQIWVDGEMKYEKAIKDQSLGRALKHNQAVSLVLRIGDDELPGTSARAFDLGLGQVSVVLSGSGVTAVAPDTLGAIAAKQLARFGYLVQE